MQAGNTQTDSRMGQLMTATGEWLSALDTLFLRSESATSHMHVAVTAVFDGTPLRTEAGGVDIDRVRAYIASRLHLIPRYRQRLAFGPIGGRPIWVDDAHFNIAYHVRHVSLPRPGDDAQLQRLAGRIKSQQLDRQKPLWEVWVVEGLADGRMALITKTHHCMIDGLSGAELLAVLLRPEPTDDVETAPPFVPQPGPSVLELAGAELRRRAGAPAAALDAIVRNPLGAARRLASSLQAVAEAAPLLRPTSETAFNRPIGPHRRFAWWTLDLERVKFVKNVLGGTVNDVVLATVAGALRQLLAPERQTLRELDLRALVPVSTRTSVERGQLGNRVSAWIVPLPVAVADPARRLHAVAAETQRSKAANQAESAAALTSLSEWAGASFLSAAVRLAVQLRPFNVVVTNVPGPTMPLHLLGARMLAVYPQVPLFPNQGLGIALFSYAGALHWGFNADWDVGPDPQAFANAIAGAFEELLALAAVTKARRDGHSWAVAYAKARIELGPSPRARLAS